MKMMIKMIKKTPMVKRRNKPKKNNKMAIKINKTAKIP